MGKVGATVGTGSFVCDSVRSRRQQTQNGYYRGGKLRLYDLRVSNVRCRGDSCHAPLRYAPRFVCYSYLYWRLHSLPPPLPLSLSLSFPSVRYSRSLLAKLLGLENRSRALN